MKKVSSLFALPISLALGFFALAVYVLPSFAQAPDDPVQRGAWLYEGNCVRCHGAYETTRVGRDRAPKELRDLISGKASGGCEIDWSTVRGGELSEKEIDNVVLYIMTWEERGGALNLPTLPPQPTRTPTLPATPTPQGTPAQSTLTSSRPQPNPTVQLVLDGNPIARGAWLYTQNCSICHQAYEIGRQGKDKTDKTIKQAIENGKSGTSMPAFSLPNGGDLRVAEINAIVSYLRAFETLNEEPAVPKIVFVPPTPDPVKLKMPTPVQVSVLRGDAEHGAVLFATYCVRCHGVQGQGGIAPALDREWNSIRPELTIQSTIANGIPNSLMRAWSQAKDGVLDEKQVADLTAHLMQWSDSTKR